MSANSKSKSSSKDTGSQAGVSASVAKTASGLPVEINPTEHSLLMASESRYRRLFEAAQDGILILDARTGKVEDANPFLEDMLGYTKIELTGKSLWEIGMFKDRSANQAMYQELKKNGYVRYEDLPLQTKTGESRQVEFVSNIYQVDHRRVIQCNIRDISARKKAETKTIAAHEELVTSMAELQRRDTELQSLVKLNELLQSCNSQEEAYQVIKIMGSEIFPHQNGCLAIMHSPDQTLEVVVGWGDASFMSISFFLEDCWALRRGQNHIVQDPQAGLICHHFARPVPTGYVCIPLMVQGEILGLVSITTPDEKRQQRQQQLAAIIGDAIKLSLANLRLREKLREQALTDQLTGLGNRRYLEDNLTRELARTLRRETSVCAAMLDLDHFKQFNDTYGHDAGDLLLRKIGDLLRKNLRQGDLVCRYGGEEFVIIVTDSALADVHKRLEKIREMIKNIEIQREKDRFGRISVSIGLVEAHDSDWTTSRLLRAADEALYAAKKAGRDRIAVYPAIG